MSHARQSSKAFACFSSAPTTSSTEPRLLLTPRTIHVHLAASTASRKPRRRFKLVSLLPESCIVRTSWLFGPGGKCFPDTILKLAATRPQLEVVGDQRGSPTYAIDLAGAIIQLCRQGATGIVHATNRGECTWYEFAREIVACAGLTTVVHETTSDKFVRPAQRPKYSVLSPESLERRGIAHAGLARCPAPIPGNSHVGTDALVRPVERSSTVSLPTAKLRNCTPPGG